MSPCEVEVSALGSEKRIKIGQLRPGDRPVTFSDIGEGEAGETILFECSEDDSETRIYRSGLEIEWEAKVSGGILADQELLELVKTLKAGESYEMNVTTKRGTKAVVRFTHK